MTWTQFMDMHSGGGSKEPYEYIYIEAPEEEARVIFYNRFGHNPERVSCTCCGDDYSISSEKSLLRLTGYERNCDSLETPRDPETGLYKKPDDPWFDEHYYLEPGEEDEARKRGYSIRESIAKQVVRQHGSDYGRYLTLDEYIAQNDVLVIRADEIKPEERVGDVPAQGYVWAG